MVAYDPHFSPVLIFVITLKNYFGVGNMSVSTWRILFCRNSKLIICYWFA